MSAIDAQGRQDFLEAFDVPRETLERLDAYAALLVKWQARINLVSPRSLDSLWARHFFDSAQLLPLVDAHRPGGLPASWLDLGSGAGFPGLVLAILGAGPAHLVESDGRKCSFLRQVIRATGVEASVHQSRIESLDTFGVDIVTARALAPLDRLLDHADRFWRQGCEGWFLKGADWQEELTSCAQSWTVEIETFPSRTNPTGRILRVRNMARA